MYSAPDCRDFENSELSAARKVMIQASWSASASHQRVSTTLGVCEERESERGPGARLARLSRLHSVSCLRSRPPRCSCLCLCWNRCCICRAHLLLVFSTLSPNVQVCRSSCTRRNMCCLCDYPSKVFAVLCPRCVSCCHQHPSRSLLMLSGMLHTCGKRSTTAVERVGGPHCRQMFSGARCA